MKKILLGLLVFVSLTSCEKPIESVVEQEIAINHEVVTLREVKQEVKSDNDYYVSSSLGMPNYVYIKDSFFTGEGDVNELLDWTNETGIYIDKKDELRFDFGKDEYVRLIELVNADKENGIKTIQFEFSNKIVRIYDLNDSIENQTITFENPILSNNIKVKTLKGFSNTNGGLLSELHVIGDLKLNEEDYSLHNEKNKKIKQIRRYFNWSEEISSNQKIIKDVFKKFAYEEVVELCEEVDLSILQSKFDQFIGYPLIIKGKVIETKKTGDGYNLKIKSLLDQNEYIIYYDKHVEKDSLISVSGLILGRDENDKIVIYGIK